MKRLTPVVLTSLALGLAGVAAPRPLAAGCQCSACECVHDGTVTLKCRCEGNICITGSGSGSDCPPLTTGLLEPVDGVISRETDIVPGTSHRAVLSRRACDGAVVRRQYTAATAEELRTSTRSIRV